MTRDEIDALSERVIAAAIEVHRSLGPGLTEFAYEMCLCHELELQGIACARQVEMPIEYKGETIDTGYRIDILGENEVILELKAVEEVTDTHLAQLITYLRLSNRWLGLLLNFNTTKMADGIYRRING